MDLKVYYKSVQLLFHQNTELQREICSYSMVMVCYLAQNSSREGQNGKALIPNGGTIG